MDLFDAINERKSVRWFKQDPLDESIIRKILEAAIRAPTAMAMEQWFFIVVEDEEKRKNIWELL
ncbi:MAG: nitroreductase family protein, partial [Thermoproteota archaeon]